MPYVFEDEPQKSKGGYVFEEPESRNSLPVAGLMSHNTDSKKYVENIKENPDFPLPANNQADMNTLKTTIDNFKKTEGTKTGEFLSDPAKGFQNGRLAKDHIKDLSFFEKVGDPFMTVGTMLISPLKQAVSGYVGMTEGVKSLFKGKSFDEAINAATKAMQEHIETTDYYPKTKVGEIAKKTIAYPFEKWSQLGDYLIEKDPFSGPIEKTFKKTAWEFAPYLLGIKGLKRPEAIANHVQGILDAAKEIKADPITKRAFVDHITKDHPPVQMPVDRVEDVLRNLIPEEFFEDPTSYYEAKFGEGGKKVDISISDLAVNTDKINPENIKDMSLEGEPSVNELEAAKQEAPTSQDAPQSTIPEKGTETSTTPKEDGFLDLEPAVKIAKEAIEKIKEGHESSKLGEAVRTYYTGARDRRIAETNQLRDEIKAALPDYQDQEALTFLRDARIKKDPEWLNTILEEAKKSNDPRIKKLVPIIERAINPSEKMLEADRKITELASKHLEEGKKLGVLESSLSPEEYITHLLEPEEKAGKGKRGIGGGKIGRYTPFAKHRTYETIWDALQNPKVKAKTLNALDAMTIYGDKHATAVATRLLVNELKDTEMGKWGFRSSKNIPNDWVEIAPGRELFRNRIKYIDEEGKPQEASQNLYVPEKIADALAPIIDPASIANIPGFRRSRVYQAYIKAAQLGLALFHMKALNVTAMNNMKELHGWIKAYGEDMASPEFKGQELHLIEHGLTTPILGRTIEAYRAVQPSTFPTKLDMIRNLPAAKQFDRFASGLTHLTFDVIQRKDKVYDASTREAAWIAEHPNATPVEHTAALRSITKEVNAAYGGLHWENLGVYKNTLELSRALMLAHDWTFSNVLNAKYAFEGGPAGNASRLFWIKSAITGVALTQGLSMLVSGQHSDHLTEVYLGKDKNGNDTYSNMFFAGAPKDFITFVNNIKDYGPIMGVAHSIAAKLGPLARTAIEILTNRNWLGQEIVLKGSGIVKGILKGGAEAGSNLLPIPFSITNIAKMIKDPEDKYGFWDYLSVLGGTPPRHKSDVEQQIANLQGRWIDSDEEAVEKRQLRRKVINDIRKHKAFDREKENYWSSLNKEQQSNIIKESRMTPKQAAFSHLPTEKIMKLWPTLPNKDQGDLFEIYNKRIKKLREKSNKVKSAIKSLGGFSPEEIEEGP